jgi:hypothetical protein
MADPLPGENKSLTREVKHLKNEIRSLHLELEAPFHSSHLKKLQNEKNGEYQE